MLPLDIPPPSSLTSPFAQRSPATGRQLDPPGVLVVDDDTGVRQFIATWLTRDGFAVWSAADGDEAVAAFRARRESIRIVLLDVQMPKRDGPQVLSDLQAIDPGIRVCFMTGNPGRYTVEQLEALGALAVFTKPLGLREVATRLADLLHHAVVSHTGG